MLFRCLVEPAAASPPDPTAAATADPTVAAANAHPIGPAPPTQSEPTAAEALSAYLTLSVSLSALHADFAKADPRFAQLAPFLRGARMLRQDPTECLFSFICSSNNHISRIHGMVERLCRAYGERLGEAGGAEYFAFPTLGQLAAASEADLRGLGFGYRAKFITGSVAMLLAKPGGGAAWLQGARAALRSRSLWRKKPPRVLGRFSAGCPRGSDPRPRSRTPARF